jgi:hypothetical protein
MEWQWKNLYRYSFQTSTRVLIKLDDSRSTKMVKGLLDSLPFEIRINKWGVKNSTVTRSQLKYRRRMRVGNNLCPFE